MQRRSRSTSPHANSAWLRSAARLWQPSCWPWFSSATPWRWRRGDPACDSLISLLPILICFSSALISFFFSTLSLLFLCGAFRNCSIGTGSVLPMRGGDTTSLVMCAHRDNRRRAGIERHRLNRGNVLRVHDTALLVSSVGASTRVTFQRRSFRQLGSNGGRRGAREVLLLI